MNFFFGWTVGIGRRRKSGWVEMRVCYSTENQPRECKKVRSQWNLKKSWVKFDRLQAGIVEVGVWRRVQLNRNFRCFPDVHFEDFFFRTSIKSKLVFSLKKRFLSTFKFALNGFCGEDVFPISWRFFIVFFVCFFGDFGVMIIWVIDDGFLLH